MIFNENLVSDQELERLMNEYGNDVLRIAYLYLKDQSLAEDAFQEVFLKVYKKYSSFRNNSSEKTWIIRIAINVCKDLLKTNWSKLVVSYDESFLNQIPDDFEVDQLFEKKQLFEEIKNLPNKYKDVIILYYYQGYDILEIATILKSTTGSVSSLLKRARDLLKIKIEN